MFHVGEDVKNNVAATCTTNFINTLLDRDKHKYVVYKNCIPTIMGNPCGFARLNQGR